MPDEAADQRWDRARLEEVVRQVVDLRTSAPAEAQPDEPAPAAAAEAAEPGAAEGQGFTYEAYSALVKRDIEAKYSVSGPLRGVIEAKLADKFAGQYSQDDIRKAVDLANDLLLRGLLCETSYGDYPIAAEELRRAVPGFSEALYSSIIAYFGWVNR
jgi:hypothetical protein